jgi:hypothetical protein
MSIILYTNRGGSSMYAQIVSMELKTIAATEFTHTLENDVLPVLRKPNGFRDEITLFAPEPAKVTEISFWSKKENAEEYNRTTYPGVLRLDW